MSKFVFYEFGDYVMAFDRAKNGLEISKSEYDSALIKLQEQCKHDKITEIPYRAGHFVDLSCRRICEICGLEEEATHVGFGFDILITDRPKITNSATEFYSHRK